MHGDVCHAMQGYKATQLMAAHLCDGKNTPRTLPGAAFSKEQGALDLARSFVVERPCSCPAPAEQHGEEGSRVHHLLACQNARLAHLVVPTRKDLNWNCSGAWSGNSLGASGPCLSRCAGSLRTWYADESSWNSLAALGLSGFLSGCTWWHGGTSDVASKVSTGGHIFTAWYKTRWSASCLSNR